MLVFELRTIWVKKKVKGLYVQVNARNSLIFMGLVNMVNNDWWIRNLRTVNEKDIDSRFLEFIVKNAMKIFKIFIPSIAHFTFDF